MHSTKETLTGRARPDKLMQTSLWGIAQKAKRLKKYRFRDLYRMLNENSLKYAWSKINKKSATGIDKVSAKDFEDNLDDNIKKIVNDLKGKRYHAGLVRRVYIDKGNGKKRPLGIPVTADKVLQRAAANILESIYEQDFIETSYGYRPNRSAHTAVKALSKELQHNKYSYIVEADISGFFDNIDHEWMVKFLEHRIKDKQFIRLIKKWLKAGIINEDGKVTHPVTGSPQGGIISPVLANIYLHYVLDIWFAGKIKPESKGEAYLCRYADDFVCAFRYKNDAIRFYHKLMHRLSKFGLKLSEEKTNIISFSRFRKYEKSTFDFLGFEFRWGTCKRGKDSIKRRTSRKKFRKSVKNFKEWCKESRNYRLKKLFDLLNAKLRGYYNYYGLIGNYKSLEEFYHIARKILYKWLNRRSQRRSFNWEQFDNVTKIYKMMRPRITEKNEPVQLKFEFA